MRSRLIASVIITTLAAAALAWWLMPTLLHRHLIAKITSPDLQQRQRGLNYVIRRAAERPYVMRDAVAALDVPDDENFIQIAAALQRGATWSYPTIPFEPYVRWIEILGRDRDAESRILAAQLLISLRDRLTEPRIADLLATWLKDDDAEVRLNALAITAEIAAITDLAAPYPRMLLTAVNDTNPAIARDAWIFLGLLDLAARAPAGSGSPAEKWARGERFEHQAPPAADRREILRALSAPQSHVRDVACVLADRRWSEEGAQDLILNLLSDFNDDAKRSGAILVGLTRQLADTLIWKIGAEDVWSVRQIQFTAQAMMGLAPSDYQIAPLLTRDDLPRSTLLLAMLRIDRHGGLDALLTPRADETELQLDGLEDPVSLTELLTRHQWALVLQHLAPEAPPVHIGADPVTQQLQVDILRNWWLIERHRPPGPGSR